MTRPVLFVCSNRTHVQMFMPVARHLIDEFAMPVRWLALDNYYGQRAAMVLAESGWKGHEQLPRPSGRTATPWDGDPMGRVYILREGRREVRAFLRNARPAVIVLGNDIGTLERLFISLGREMHIPTFLLQEGIIKAQKTPGQQFGAVRRLLQAAMNSLGLRMADARGYGQNGADRIAVMGVAFKVWLESQGVPSECVVVTGQPRYDSLRTQIRISADGADAVAARISGQQKIILFSSQPFLRYNACDEKTARWIWHTVLAGVNGLGAGHHLIAKLHPAEDLDFTRGWLGDAFPDHWTLTHEGEILSLVSGADVLLTVSSTTALEAMSLGKPVVILDAGLGPPPIPYVESGAALGARNADELTACLRQMLYSAQVREQILQASAAFVGEYMHRVDGQSALRVALEILKLLPMEEA